MLFPRKTKPEACASREATRYVIQGCAVVEISGQNYLGATDGYCASLIPVELEAGDHPDGVYPAAAFAAARKAATKHAPRAQVAVNGAAVVRSSAGEQTFARIETRFPDIASVMPEGAPQCRIILDAKRLATIAAALGTDDVELSIYDGYGPIGVRPFRDGSTDYDGGRAAIMPSRHRRS